MYLHELKCDTDRLLVNSHDQYVVLNPTGAVFQNFFTDDPRNMCIAFGRLFDDDWRETTAEEYSAWMAKPPARQMLRLDWNEPPPPEPRLRLISPPSEDSI